MKLDNVFKKTRQTEHNPKENTSGPGRPEVPEGLLRKCNKCGKAIITEDVERGYYICPKCGGYFRVPAYQRIEMLADEGSFVEWDAGLQSSNPMGYKGYEEKKRALREKTGLSEAVVTGEISIKGQRTVIGVCDGRFLMASMGEAVGEKITLAVERATREGLPVILFACSGGARMQEGIVSLMQMAKTSAALKRHSDAGLLYISVLTDPTTGGVTASFAMLGDVILAEPQALIGFAGPRVIEQTIRQKLPKGFQRAEFLLEHGFLDGIVERPKLRDTLYEILRLHEKSELQPEESPDPETAVPEKAQETKTAWDRVQISRRKDRPVGSDYIRELFGGFVELHGDRRFGDDPAIVGGIAWFHGRPVTVIAQEKGNDTKENIRRNFGMPGPEGYRKALRLMKQAEKFHRPVICLVDTPGAFCGIGAEERGQGEAIAENLYEMSALKVPILSVIIGEGGSGGALAMATSDEVWILENSVYSILSPEGFASILWKDSTRAKEASEVMKMTAEHLYEGNIVEKVFSEPDHLTVETLPYVTEPLEKEIGAFLARYEALSEEALLEHRYNRFRML
ncbi:MAG: acetyl-CoA carboxylase carboxyltransferase subunit alpha [Blautia sp.]|nr:acetyl-CoA carboxylase carboxyltransferase subunit alpha [Blautia sp.]MDY5032567.1 acetyl-CoA carboxylase carboxyltransferase subunit alpha [Blautia sp.]